MAAARSAIGIRGQRATAATAHRFLSPVERRDTQVAEPRAMPTAALTTRWENEVEQGSARLLKEGQALHG